MITDNHDRPVKNIRISINADCNLSCYYCHGEGQQINGNGKAMSPKEIGKIMEVASSLGVEKVKITGGEPLTRNDVVDIVAQASEHMNEVSMTTNGTLLAPIAGELRDAGLARVNISLDTVNRDRYAAITGSDKLSDALNGISSAVEEGLLPVKVNIVALEDSTVSDILGTIGTVWGLGAIPQVIEPVGGGVSETMQSLEDQISSKAKRMRERQLHRRRVYTLDWQEGREVDVEVVRPIHNTVFCAHCTRLRVTSNGMLKPCLMHNNDLVDVLAPIRNGAGVDELQELFKKAVSYREPYWK